MQGLLPDEPSRVLEVGCGEGLFSASISTASEKWGVEPNDVAAARATRHLDRVLTGTYEDVASRIPDHHFDLVVCNDVIEHMVDPTAFLRNVQAKMSTGGYLVGSVPNVRYYRNLMRLLLAKDWRYVDSGILDRTHLRFYTLKSVRRELTEAGLCVETVQGVGSEFRAGARSAATRLARGLVLGGLLIATLGLHADIRFLQCGFRARLQPGEGGCPTSI